MFALRHPALFSWEPGKESGHGQNHRDKGEALWPRRLLSGVGVGVRKSDEQPGEGEGGTGRGGGAGEQAGRKDSHSMPIPRVSHTSEVSH